MAQIGKKSRAHTIANQVFKKRNNPTKIVHSKDIIKIIERNKKRSGSI